MVELKEKFLTYQKDISDSFAEDDQILKVHLEAIDKVYQDYDISQEQLGTIVTEILGKSIDSMYQLTSTSAMELIREEKQQELIDAQIATAEADTESKVRYTKGFDDNLLIKIVEQQAGLASYAVNANSTTAQDTINDLKCKMNNVEVRVEQIEADNPPASCPE